MLLVCDCLNAFCRLDLETGCELIWAELPTSGSSVLFGVVYRPPQSPLSYLEKLCSSMLCAVNCCVLILFYLWGFQLTKHRLGNSFSFMHLQSFTLYN